MVRWSFPELNFDRKFKGNEPDMKTSEKFLSEKKDDATIKTFP